VRLRDTRLVRLGVRLGFGQEYEIAAVAGNGLRAGLLRVMRRPGALESDNNDENRG
jgi:hypothetical protein